MTTLTAVTVDENNSARPKDIAYLSIGTGDTAGILATLNTTSPATGQKVQVIEIISDTDYYWSYRDSQVAADGTMVKVFARQVLRCEVPPGAAGLTLYMKASSGTAKMSVVHL